MFRAIPALAMCASLVAQGPAPGTERLTLQDALRISLQNNLQVDIAREARNQAQAGYLSAQGAFDWNLAASLAISRIEGATQTPLYPGYPVIPIDYTSYNRSGASQGPELDLNRAFTWGGSLDLAYNGTYANQKVTNAAVPAYQIPAETVSSPVPWSATLTATYTQNFLQGFGTEVTTAPLVIARKNGLAADLTYEASLISLVSATEGYYWNLVYAQRWLQTKRRALELAQKHLDENKFRLKTGTIARLDVLGAEAQVAQAEQDIIAAQAQLENAQDTLVRALYPNAQRPGHLEAADAPDLSHIQLGEDEAVKMALARRVELKSAHLALDIAQLQQKVAADKTRPVLSGSAQYNGSSDNYAALGPANKDLVSAKFPGYTLGVKYSQPLQNRAARGGLASAQANARSSALTLHDQELSIVLQVRTAYRNIEAAEKGVKAAEKTRFFLNKTLEAEQFKFSRGVSTSFVVLQDLTNLTNAQSAEVQAQITYANAVTALEQAVGNLLQARHFEVK